MTSSQRSPSQAGFTWRSPDVTTNAARTPQPRAAVCSFGTWYGIIYGFIDYRMRLYVSLPYQKIYGAGTGRLYSSAGALWLRAQQCGKFTVDVSLCSLLYLYCTVLPADDLQLAALCDHRYRSGRPLRNYRYGTGTGTGTCRLLVYRNSI